jgi:hypothetical protein
VPTFASVTAVIVGFCNVELNNPGPVHEYERLPLPEPAIKNKGLPRQTGLTTLTEMELTTATLMVPVVEEIQSLLLETINVYTPSLAGVETGMEILCVFAENAFGPFHV